MSSLEFLQLLDFFKALANESRLKLIGLLAQREHSVEELAALLKLKEPTVSHHLHKLKTLDLVEMRSIGNTHLYRLNTTALQALNKSLFSADQFANWVADVDSDAWENTVLAHFLDGENRLSEIPASRKKRWVILKWLAQKFELGTLYPERELNQVIQQHHWDSATLRREMIGYGMMQRERGVYWRNPESQWKPSDWSGATI